MGLHTVKRTRFFSTSLISALFFCVSSLSYVCYAFAMEDSGYDSDLEYTSHQKVSEKFFCRLTKNPYSREAIEKFQKEISHRRDFSQPIQTTINLSGLSSRTRILLFRELTASAEAQFESIPFIFHEKTFTISLQPSLRQAGDGIVSGIGKHIDIYNCLHRFKPIEQGRYAARLLDARQKYHPRMENSFIEGGKQRIDLELLNILLDFEVARRLQRSGLQEKSIQEEGDFAAEVLDIYAEMARKGDGGCDQETFESLEARFTSSLPYVNFSKTIERNHDTNTGRAEHYDEADQRKLSYMNSDKQQLDRVPVASAIIGAIKLSTKEEGQFSFDKFFHAPSVDFPSGYNWGEFSAFEGRPGGGRREAAVKRVIKELRGGTTAKNATLEEIHQEYLEVFGGGSESDGESYGD